MQNVGAVADENIADTRIVAVVFRKGRQLFRRMFR